MKTYGWCLSYYSNYYLSFVLALEWGFVDEVRKMNRTFFSLWFTPHKAWGYKKKKQYEEEKQRKAY